MRNNQARKDYHDIYLLTLCHILFIRYIARSVMVIVVGNGHGDMSSNPRQD